MASSESLCFVCTASPVGHARGIAAPSASSASRGASCETAVANAVPARTSERHSSFISNKKDVFFGSSRFLAARTASVSVSQPFHVVAVEQVTRKETTTGELNWDMKVATEADMAAVGAMANLPQDLLKFYINRRDGTFLIAVADKKIIGFIIGNVTRGVLAPGGKLTKRGEIVTMKVLDRYQKKRVGRTLLQAVLKKMKTDGCEDSFICEPPEEAVSFFKRAGYVKHPQFDDWMTLNLLGINPDPAKRVIST